MPASDIVQVGVFSLPDIPHGTAPICPAHGKMILVDISQPDDRFRVRQWTCAAAQCGRREDA